MTVSSPLLPNFLVIGASRSGTTALYHQLRAHSQIYLTPVMEPRFFVFEGSDLAYRGPGDHLLKDRVVTRLEDYAALFDAVDAEIAIGEISPAYLSDLGAAARIHRHIPNAKIIAILRNPVERAISSFRLERLDGFEPLADLSDALAQEADRKRAGWSYVWAYRERGFYYRQLRHYFDLFPKERIMVRLYEDWQCEDVPLFPEILEFLGVEPDANLSRRQERHNTTDRETFSARGVEWFEPSAELVRNLVDGYRTDVQLLGELIERDLTAWLER